MDEDDVNSNIQSTKKIIGLSHNLFSKSQKADQQFDNIPIMGLQNTSIQKHTQEEKKEERSPPPKTIQNPSESSESAHSLPKSTTEVP